MPEHTHISRECYQMVLNLQFPRHHSYFKKESPDSVSIEHRPCIVSTFSTGSHITTSMLQYNFTAKTKQMTTKPHYVASLASAIETFDNSRHGKVPI